MASLMRQMAHDMRGPLGTLTGTSELLAQGVYGELTAQQTRATERIQRNSARLVALLDDLMLYVKAQAGQLSLHPAPFEPRVLLNSLREQTAADAANKGLTVHWATAEAVPPQVVGDADHIARALWALLTNAIGFSKSGDVWITADWVEGQWVISVRDSGPGIPQEDQQHMFEPFFRGAQRPQMPSSGFGLGLAVVAALASVMHGQITLDQSGASGSTFTLRLPLAVHP